MTAKNTQKEENLEEKVLFVNRCSKVVKGGRKFSFSALILVGDRNGRIGYGFAKANELTDAIRKGGDAARKNMMTFEREGSTIPHEITVEFDGAKVMMKPAPKGTGIVAGSRLRAILELAGVIEDVVTKNMGSNNPMNVVKAAFMALAQLRNRQETLKVRQG